MIMNNDKKQPTSEGHLRDTVFVYCITEDHYKKLFLNTSKKNSLKSVNCNVLCSWTRNCFDRC